MGSVLPLSLTEVARSQVTAAQAGSATASVSIDLVTLWNAATGTYTAPPVQGVEGQQIGVRVVASNFGVPTLAMRVNVVVDAPDSSLVEQVGTVQVIAGGEHTGTWDFKWVATQHGTYTVVIKLFAGLDASSLVWGPTQNATIPVVAPAAAGAIPANGIFYWNPATQVYQPGAPTIVVGQEAGVEALGSNPLGIAQNMRMDIEVTDPDGVKSTAAGTQQSVAAGANALWPFRWACPKVGTYSATLILYAEVP